jgi:class 3 adenylate cyclase
MTIPNVIDATTKRFCAILVTDLENFTSLLERIGDDAGLRVARAHHSMLRQRLPLFGGQEHAITGDGMIASFPSATAALSCAALAQYDFQRYNEAVECTAPLRVRIGIHMGWTQPDEERLFGHCVNIAVRVCTVAVANQVLVSLAVAEAVGVSQFCFRELGARSLKGATEPIEIREMDWRSIAQREEARHTFAVRPCAQTRTRRRGWRPTRRERRRQRGLELSLLVH